MKTEDIDKKINMPDVDAEWARFEKEIIGRKTNSVKKIWLGGLSIAASIILVTGLFLLGLDNKESKQILSKVEEPDITHLEIPAPIETPSNMLTTSSPSKKESKANKDIIVTQNTEEENHIYNCDHEDAVFRTDKAYRSTYLAQKENAERELQNAVRKHPKNELALTETPRPKKDWNPKELEGLAFESVDQALKNQNDGLNIPSHEYSSPVKKAKKARKTEKKEKNAACSFNAEGLAFESVDKPLQGQIAGLDIVPNSSALGGGITMRLRGTAVFDDKKHPLVVVNNRIVEIPDSVDYKTLDTEEQFANLLGIKLKDLKSIVVLKDDESTAKWGEKGKYGVIKITTKPSLALKDGDKPLEGQIAGLDPSRFHGKVVSSNFRRPGFDEECDCYDSTLILLNGKEDVDFIKHYKKYFGTLREEDEMNKYIFQRNLVLFKILRYNDNEVSDYAHLFKGRPIKRIWDYQAKPFTPASQLSAKELEERRVNYLRNTYLKGDSGKHYVRHFAPELFSSTLKERLFGILTTTERSTLHQYFGAVKKDSHGIYVPFIREATISASNDISFFDEGTYIIKDDPFIKKLIRDFKKTAKRADSSAEKKDSLFRIGFIYGGRVKDVPLHWFHYFSHGFGNLQKMLQGSSFDFVPDTDAPSYWWGEVYYSTNMPSQREGILIFLHAVDKLYATDCPEILTNRRCITGIVEDENGAPMAGVEISPYGGNYEGVKTDSTGRFELWLPYQDVKAFASKVGYKIRGIEPTDSAVTIHMKELNLNLIITPPPFEEK